MTYNYFSSLVKINKKFDGLMSVCMKIIFLIFILTILFHFSSCSHTDYLTYEPEYGKIELPNLLSSVTQKFIFVKGDFKDLRKDTITTGFFKEGIHKYTFYNNEPFSSTLFNSFKRMIVNSGHKYNDNRNGDILVNIFLNKIYLDFVDHIEFPLFLTSSGIESKLNVNIDFIDLKTSNVIFSKNYHVTGFSPAGFTTMNSLAEKSVGESIIQLLNSVSNDTNFVNKLISMSVK